MCSSGAGSRGGRSSRSSSGGGSGSHCDRGTLRPAADATWRTELPVSGSNSYALLFLFSSLEAALVS